MKSIHHLFLTLSFLFAYGTSTGQALEGQEYDKVVTYLEISASFGKNEALWSVHTPRDFFVFEETTNFYKKAGFQPVWVSRRGTLKPSAHKLVEYIGEMLYPEYFAYAHLQSLLSAYEEAKEEGDDSARLLGRLELALTRAFLKVGDVNLKGYAILEEDGEDMSWFLSSRLKNIPKLLEVVAVNEKPAEVLNTLLPKDRQFSQLKEFVKKFQDIASRGGWPVLPEEITEIKPGDTSQVVNTLRKRLVITEDLANAHLKGDVYDEYVEKAVLFYQGRNGLEMDGVIGKNTFDNLNISVEERIRQLQVNIERSKWLPDERGEQYIWVNIPEYKLRLYSDGKIIQEHKVVAGSKRTQTPCFDSYITDVVVNPYWNVPYSIAKNEIGPKVNENAQYLLDKNYEVINGWGSNETIPDSTEVDWADKKSYHKVRFRQKPGPGNALGQLKFNLPSRWSIYLHDTPSKSAFERTHRALSHGCVRVHNPKDLAATLLKSNPDWDKEKLTQMINKRQTRTALMQENVNIFIVYMTSWVDEDGQLQLREDVYGRDNKFDQKLRQI